MKCSFCGIEKNSSEIVTGITGNICYDCIEACSSLTNTTHGSDTMLKPHEIKKLYSL